MTAYEFIFDAIYRDGSWKPFTVWASTYEEAHREAHIKAKEYADEHIEGSKSFDLECVFDGIKNKL